MISAVTEFEAEASWAEYSSTKFLFFGHLIDIASMRDLHLIIAAQNDRKRNTVERYLLGKGFAYTRPRDEMGGSVEVSLVKNNLSFGVHSADSVRDIYKAPSAIFVLDSNFNAKAPAVEYIRTTYTRNGGLLPVIWLLIPNTCEHIQRCLPDSAESNQLRLLMQYTARLHYDAGDLQDDAPGVHESAEEILTYLVDPLAVAWPLPAIEPLCGAADMEDSTSSSDDSNPATQKRSLVCVTILEVKISPTIYSCITSPIMNKRITPRNGRGLTLSGPLIRPKRKLLNPCHRRDWTQASFCT